MHCFAKLYKVMSVYCNFRISRAYSAYLSIYDILCILIIFLFVTARIDDGEESADWEVKDHRTGESVPLRADRWFQNPGPGLRLPNPGPGNPSDPEGPFRRRHGQR